MFGQIDTVPAGTCGRHAGTQGGERQWSGHGVELGLQPRSVAFGRRRRNCRGIVPSARPIGEEVEEGLHRFWSASASASWKRKILRVAPRNDARALARNQLHGRRLNRPTIRGTLFQGVRLLMCCGRLISRIIRAATTRTGQAFIDMNGITSSRATAFSGLH